MSYDRAYCHDYRLLVLKRTGSNSNLYLLEQHPWHIIVSWVTTELDFPIQRYISALSLLTRRNKSNILSFEALLQVFVSLVRLSFVFFSPICSMSLLAAWRLRLFTIV
jgi:hypothetical protein